MGRASCCRFLTSSSQRVVQAEGFTLPAAGDYGVGMVFLPQDSTIRAACEALVAQIVAEEGQTLIGWRTVPTDGMGLGKAARSREPLVRQLFVGGNATTLAKDRPPRL